MNNIPVHELSRVWPQVRHLLSTATDKFGERITPEELYHLLRTNMATLYMDTNGCLVAQKLNEPDGTITLFVLLVAGNMANVWQEWIAMVEKLAGAIGAVRIKMASPSRAWERAMDGYWQVSHVVYEHDLRNGNVQVAA